MGQSEIMECLRKENKPLSRSEISERIGIHPNKVSYSLGRLIKFKEVKAIDVERKIALKKYGCCRRMRLFIIIK